MSELPSPELLFAEQAHAKINLTLKVGGATESGYHPLQSLVCFAEFGDELQLRPDQDYGLEVKGRFASPELEGPKNLVMQASQAFSEHFDKARVGRFILQKNLPPASGIGGGSADGAAALRLLAALHRLAPDAPELFEIAAKLGSDTPMCLAQKSRFVTGHGDELGPRVTLPPCALVLAHPGKALSTPDVFRKFDELGLASALPPAFPDPPWQDFDAFLGYLAAEGNDLLPAAAAMLPEIAALITDLKALPGARYAAMSGSGATCFALFPALSDAEHAAGELRRQRPGFWIVASRVLGS